ncbi:MAG TPA: hypothetical protein VK014_03465 [Cyclobacteriaceae bacterium]|nr:hypothetical protein [Cyclobacteriaceae bacterium]
MQKIYSLFIFLLLSLFSCQARVETPADLGKNYQPLAVGKYWVYHVHETVYFGESDEESAVYYLRDLVQSDYFNEEGEQVFVVVREKSDDQQHWTPYQTFSWRISRSSIIRQQDNQPLVTLILPPTAGASWNGNVFNANQEEWFQLEVMDEYTLDNIFYNDVVKVVHQEEEDKIVLRDMRYEVYGKDIGMIESYYEVLNYCSRNDCLGQQIVESGRFTHLKLIQYE